jgi:hypothetical protein
MSTCNGCDKHNYEKEIHECAEEYRQGDAELLKELQKFGGKIFLSMLYFVLACLALLGLFSIYFPAHIDIYIGVATGLLFTLMVAYPLSFHSARDKFRLEFLHRISIHAQRAQAVIDREKDITMLSLLREQIKKGLLDLGSDTTLGGIKVEVPAEEHVCSSTHEKPTCPPNVTTKESDRSNVKANKRKRNTKN